MLKRNAVAIITWDYHMRKGMVSPLKFDDAILHLTCLTFPDFNVVPMENGVYLEHARDMIPIAVRGETGLIRTYYNSKQLPPSPVLDSVITGVRCQYYKSLADVGFIFPFFEDVVEFDALGIQHVPGNDNKLNDFAQAMLLKHGDGLREALAKCLAATRKLQGLNLYVRERVTADDIEIGSNFLLATGPDAKLQVLMNPVNLEFRKDPRMELTNAETLDMYISNIFPDAELDLSSIIEDQVVNYDLPEWKGDSPQHVSKLLSIFPGSHKSGKLVSQRHLLDYVIGGTLDRLMCLICFGYAEEVQANSQIELRLNVDKCFFTHFKQIPYDRMAISQLIHLHELQYKQLYDPNEYRELYRQLTCKDMCKTHPTLPPEDPFYFLGDICEVKAEQLHATPPKTSDYPLHVDSIAFTRIKINGVEFKSDDLKLFYNTQFYDLVTCLTKTGQQDISISYIRIADLIIIKDLLEGRIMAQTFRRELSPQGVVFFGGDRTFYQLTQYATSLLVINSVFSFGKRFLHQLKGLGDTCNDCISLLLLYTVL